MKNFFKIAFIATTHGTISSFMLAHIRKLSIKHDIFICCKDAHLLKKLVPKNVILNNINFKREPDLVYDLIALFKLVNVLLERYPLLLEEFQIEFIGLQVKFGLQKKVLVNFFIDF